MNGVQQEALSFRTVNFRRINGLGTGWTQAAKDPWGTAELHRGSVYHRPIPSLDLLFETLRRSEWKLNQLPEDLYANFQGLNKAPSHLSGS